MKVFVTVLRGFMHKRTERIELESDQLLTDDLLQAVGRRLMLSIEAFRLVRTVEKHNLRVVRGWPLNHYDIVTGCTLSLTIEQPPKLNIEPEQACTSPSKQLQRVQQDPQEQLEDVLSSGNKNRTTSESSMTSKSSMRSFLDSQLEKLLEQATNGTLQRFSMVLREQPAETELMQNLDYFEQRIQHLLSELGNSGWGVLHCAVFNGKVELVEFLLIKGANPNVETVEGWTSLMLAIKAQNMRILKALLNHPFIEVNQATKQGTALCLAVQADLVSFVEALLKHKASQRIAGRDGVLPTELCRSTQMQQIFQERNGVVDLQPFIVRGVIMKQTALYMNQVRYLVCDGYEGTLIRYECEEHYPRKPIEIVRLKDILEVRVIPKEELQWLAKKSLFYFQIFHPERLIYCTESKQVTEFWVESIFKMVAISFLKKERKFNKTNPKIIRTTLKQVLQDHSEKSESILSKSRGPSIFGSIIQKNQESMDMPSTVESPPMKNAKSPTPDMMEGLDIRPIRKRTGTEPALQRSQDRMESTCTSDMKPDSKILESEKSKAYLKKSCSIARESEDSQSPQLSNASFVKKWKSASGISSSEVVPRVPIQFSSFEVIKQLGKGAFGRVFLAKHKATDRIFALKALSKRTLTLQRQLRYAVSQSNILRQADHPFIVKLWYAFQTQQNLYMCLDYCSCGDLSQYLAHKQKLQEKQAKWIVAQLMLALQYLHAKNILYRDLKPENILLHEDGYIRLADFGLSKADTVGLTYSFCGSPAYLSPEMVTQRGVGKEVDVYGIGCVLHQILVGEPPHFAPDLDQLYKNIRQGKLKLPNTLSEEAKDLLKNLLQKEPTRRISIPQAKKHPFFQGINFEELQAGRCGRSHYQNISKVSTILRDDSDSESHSSYESFSDVDYEPEPTPRVNRVLKFSFNRQDEQ